MTTRNINKLLYSPQCWPLRSLFPELSEAMFRQLALYATGTSNAEAARLCCVSENTVKQNLARCREALGQEELTAVRTIFLLRMVMGLFNVLPAYTDCLLSRRGFAQVQENAMQSGDDNHE